MKTTFRFLAAAFFVAAFFAVASAQAQSRAVPKTDNAEAVLPRTTGGMIGLPGTKTTTNKTVPVIGISSSAKPEEEVLVADPPNTPDPLYIVPSDELEFDPLEAAERALSPGGLFPADDPDLDALLGKTPPTRLTPGNLAPDSILPTPQNDPNRKPRPTGATAGAGVMPVSPYQVTTPRIGTGNVQYGQHFPQNPQKPFEGYKPAPKFNPWLEMNRGGNYTGIDNYTLYVKPALEAEQERQNSQSRMHETQLRQQNAARAERPAAVGASYGDINNGVGATYGVADPSAYGVTGSSSAAKTGTSRKAPKAEDEEDEEEAPRKPVKSNNFDNLNPYAPAGNKSSMPINPYQAR